MKFAILTLATGLAISQVAAFYSIFGLMAVFSGMPLAIQIMAGALEIGKLVTTAWLHKNWSIAALKKKVVGVAMVVILMIITSIGIFGFLSKAHVGAEFEMSQSEIRLEQIDQKIQQEQVAIDRNQRILDQLDAAIDEYVDRGFVTRGLQKREEQQEERALATDQIQQSEDVIAGLQIERQEASRVIADVETEVGPVKHVAQLIYGDEADGSIDKAVRILIIMIMFVFDPLAIMLLLMAQDEFDRRKKSEESEVQKKFDQAVQKMQTPEHKEGVDKVFNATPEELAEAADVNAGSIRSKQHYDLERYAGKNPDK